MLERILQLGKERGCSEVWVLTEADNILARSLYESIGGVEPEGVTEYSFKIGG